MAITLEQFDLLPDTVKTKLLESQFGSDKVSDYVELTVEERIRILTNILSDWEDNFIQPNSPKHKIVQSIKMICFWAEKGAGKDDDDKYSEGDKYLSRNLIQEAENIWEALGGIE